MPKNNRTLQTPPLPLPLLERSHELKGPRRGREGVLRGRGSSAPPAPQIYHPLSATNLLMARALNAERGQGGEAENAFFSKLIGILILLCRPHAQSEEAAAGPLDFRRSSGSKRSRRERDERIGEDSRVQRLMVCDA
jgi:hypothetical protein